MPIINRIADFAAEMTAWRQDFHAHPELGFEEHRTSDIVAAKLAELGDRGAPRHRRTGVVGVLRNGDSRGRAIGLRADMDACRCRRRPACRTPPPPRQDACLRP